MGNDRPGSRPGWHRHDALVLVGVKCPACRSPAGDLLVYRHNPSKKLFLMCQELEEGWWSPDHVTDSPELFPWRDLEDWQLAVPSDLESADWDSSLFHLEEKWWTN